MSAASPTPDEFAERAAKIQQLQADAMLKLFDVLKRDQDIRFRAGQAARAMTR
jgi:hypothetical protein